MSEALRTSVAVPGGVAFFTSSFESAKALLRLIVGAMTADCSTQKCCRAQGAAELLLGTSRGKACIDIAKAYTRIKV
jgi:hypothetical protein